MKILYGYPCFPSIAYGDVRKIVLAHIGRLQAAGFDVEGFCLTLSPPAHALNFAELDRLWKKRDRALLKLYDALLNAIDGFDVLFNSAGINLHPEFVESLPLVTAFGCNDDPENSHNLSKPVAAAYDICLPGNIAELESYRQWGAKSVAWLPMGLQPGIWDTSLTREAILNQDREINIFMMADRGSPWRKERLDKLAVAFPDGYFFGQGWKRGYLPVGDEVSWLQRAKIGPNMHNSTGPINFRTFYLPANGVLQVCDNKSHLGKIFRLGEEVAGFDTVEECIDLCRYYIAHDEERRLIAANGWERAVTDYTEEKVFERLVSYVQPVLEAKKKVRFVVDSVTLCSLKPVSSYIYWAIDELNFAKFLAKIKEILRKKSPNIYRICKIIYMLLINKYKTL